MNVELTPPSEGKMNLELTWDEAEVLTRALGLVNTGSLRQHAPGLLILVDGLVKEFGRSNDDDERRYTIEITGQQAFLYDKENLPF